MLTLKQTLGLVAVLIAISSFIPYIHHTLKGQTKPHALTWLVWAVFTGIGFVQQWMGGGGVGSWAMGVTSVLTVFVFLFSIKYGEKEITSFDWFSLAGAGLALGLWALSRNPVLAIVLVAVVDLLGFLPTFRKSYHKPYQETLSMYWLTSLKYIFALLALESYSVITWFYPVYIIIINLLFVFMVEWRRGHVEGRRVVLVSA